jgi:hypothetical protein
MPIIERTPQRLVLNSGSTTLTLSKEADRTTLQRKILFWNLKPAEAPLSDVTDVTIEAATLRNSKVEIREMATVQVANDVRCAQLYCITDFEHHFTSSAAAARLASTSHGKTI